MYRIVLFLLIIPFFSNGQSNSEQIEVFGMVNSGYSGKPITEGFLTFAPEYGQHIWINTDSIGHFRTLELSSGTYKLNVISFGYSNIDTTIVIESNSRIELNLVLETDCQFNRSKALKDISKGKPKLLLVGSIVPIGNTKFDTKFERKYSVEYYDFGCTPETYECLADYNQTIMEHLDNEYGLTWRSSVRKDIIVE